MTDGRMYHATPTKSETRWVELIVDDSRYGLDYFFASVDRSR